MLDGLPELIPGDEQSDDQIVHTFRFGKANRAAYETFDPRSQIAVFACDFLRIGFAHRVLRGINVPLVRAPTVRGIPGDATRLQQGLKAQ